MTDTRVADLQRQFQAASDEIRAIQAQYGADLPAGQATRLDNLSRRARNLHEQITEAEQLDERLERIARFAQDPANTESGDGNQPVRPDHSPGHTFDAARRAVDNLHRSGRLPDASAERVTHLLEQGASFSRDVTSRWVQATSSNAYRTAFAKMIVDPSRGTWSSTRPSSTRSAPPAHSRPSSGRWA